MEEFGTQIFPVILGSFVSGLTGAVLGGVVVVIGMRTDVKWLKHQTEVLHVRITNTNHKLERILSKLQERIQDTRDIVLKNMP